MVSCGFSERSCYVITFYVGYMLVFLMFLWLWSFFQKSNCFCYGFVFRLFCVLLFLFLDFIIVFKRINYPVLNRVNPVWVPLVFFS